MGLGSQQGGSGWSAGRDVLRVIGDKELIRLFDQLPPKLQKKYGRAGVTKAGRIVAKAAKQYAPVRSGALKKSIGSKTKTYPKTGTVVSVVGPRADTEEDIAKGKAKYRRMVNGKLHVPAKIAHLVERGHGGPAPAGAKPFMRPAFDSNRSMCLNIIAAELEKGLRAMPTITGKQ